MAYQLEGPDATGPDRTPSDTAVAFGAAVAYQLEGPDATGPDETASDHDTAIAVGAAVAYFLAADRAASHTAVSLTLLPENPRDVSTSDDSPCPSC